MTSIAKSTYHSLGLHVRIATDVEITVSLANHKISIIDVQLFQFRVIDLLREINPMTSTARKHKWCTFSTQWLFGNALLQ